MVPTTPPTGILADDSLVYDTPSRWSTTREVASDSSFDKSLMASTSLSASFFSPKVNPGRSTPPGFPDESQRLVAHLTQIENAALLAKSPTNGRVNAVSRRGSDRKAQAQPHMLGAVLILTKSLTGSRSPLNATPAERVKFDALRNTPISAKSMHSLLHISPAAHAWAYKSQASTVMSDISIDAWSSVQTSTMSAYNTPPSLQVWSDAILTPCFLKCQSPHTQLSETPAGILSLCTYICAQHAQTAKNRPDTEIHIAISLAAT